MTTPNNQNYVPEGIELESEHDKHNKNIMFLIYGRQNSLRMWLNYGRIDIQDAAWRMMFNLMRDMKNTATLPESPRNFEIQVVAVYKDNFLDIPVSLDKNIYWPDSGMIPLWYIQENPDQTIYNGGN